MRNSEIGRETALLLFFLAGSIVGCGNEGQEGDASDWIATTCRPSDRFLVDDLGPAITGEILGLPADRSVADSSAIVLEDGRVRLYYFAQKEGISCSISENGIEFIPEAMGLLHEGYGMPRVVRLEDGRIRMFVSDWQGVWSAISEDGLAFTLEEGLRLSTEDSGFDRIGKFTILPLVDGGYRAYLHRLSIPGVNPGADHTIRSAVSPDQLTWTMEEGVLLGVDAEFLAEGAREPFPLARADGGVTLIYTNVAQLPTSLYTATSLDGITFTEAYPLNLDGAGPFVLRRPSGRYFLYYDAHDETLGHHVRVSELRLDF